MPLCAQCMREAPEGALFCPFCRAAIVPPQPKGEPPDPLVGQTIKDAYIVQERIGIGGMGRVYRAVQISLGRSVALKLLRPALESDATIVQRFHREARACSRLHHPNVIQVLDFGQTEDHALFIVMEYVPGRSLFGLLRDESPLAEPRVLHLSAQILSALAEAHRAGVVHRDLKPENVMVESRSDEPEFVKVLDFGIAKIHDPGADDGQLTRTGVLCGTPNYMSPEQASLFPIDARSDLYSVGVILYEMLTGHLPFRAATPSAMAQAHAVETPPPMSERCPPGHSVSLALEALVMKALEKEPARRFQTAEEMRRELIACPLAASPGGKAAPTLLQVLTPTAATPSSVPARSAPLTEELAGEVSPRSPAPLPLAPAPAPAPPPTLPVASAASAPSSMPAPEPEPPAGAMPPARTRSRTRLLVVLASAVAILAAGAIVVTRSRDAPSPPSAGISSGETAAPGPAPGTPPPPDAVTEPRPSEPVGAAAGPEAGAQPAPDAVTAKPSEPVEAAPGARVGAQPARQEPAEALAPPAEERQPAAPAPLPGPVARERKRDVIASAPREPQRRSHAAPPAPPAPPAAAPEPAASQRAQARPERQPLQRSAGEGAPPEPRATPRETASASEAGSAGRAAAPRPEAPGSPQRGAGAGSGVGATASAGPGAPGSLQRGAEAGAGVGATASAGSGAPGSLQRGAEAGAGVGATASAGSGAPAPPPPGGIQRAAFVTREVVSYQQVFGNPALKDRGRGLVGGAHWVLEPGGTLTFAPVAAAHGLFPMKVRATRDGSRVKFEGTNTARASDGLAYVRISGLLALGAADPLLTLDMEIGRALGPDGAELDPTYRARTRLRLAPE